MASIEVWVPLIGIGTRTDPWRPNLPDEIPWSSDEGLPTDLTSDKGLPACSSFNVIIEEKDIPAIEKHLGLADGELTKQQPPEADKLLVDMIRACRGDYDRKADAFFDSIPMDAATTERKQMVVALVEQARLRPDGLSATKALAIAQRLELDVAAPTEIKP